MHDSIIERWNKTVAKLDTVFVLGDFCFGQPWMLDGLNGQLHLVEGNHDSKATKRHDRWESVTPYKELKYEGVLFVMCHYPFESWRKSHYGSIHLHGHCHGNSREVVNRWDVGVDVFDYTPVPLSWFLERRQEQGPNQHEDKQ